MIKKIHLIFILCVLCHNLVWSQCIDPLSISPGFPCPDPTYKPVCGCDQVTYRNDCEARYRAGVLAFSDGPCSGFEFDMIPNFVGENDRMRFTFVQNTGITATMYVLDYYGKLMIQRTLPASDNFAAPFIFDMPEVNYMRPGPYIVIVFNAQGAYRFKKFVKV